MLPIQSAFENYGDRVFLDIGERKVLFAEVATAAHSIARHLNEMQPCSFVVCDCSDIERYISVFCACVIADRTIVPFSTLKLSFDELIAQLPDFAFVDADGKLSFHQGSGTPNRESGDTYCLFTSGTTGKPKGILVSASNLAAYIEGISEHIPEYKTVKNISAVFSPLFDLFYHDFLLAMAYGATLQVPTPRERMAMPDYLRARPIDIWFSTPTLAANVLSALTRNTPSEARSIHIPLSLFCGERLGAGLAINWANTMKSSVINVYGPTETTIACTAERVDTSSLEPDSDVSIGKPFGSNTANVSEKGTLVISGRQVAHYLTDGKVDSFDTKDLVSERDKKYYFLNRADRQLKIKNFQIEKEELERIACAVPGVRYAKIQPIESAGLTTGFNVVVVGDTAARSVIDAYRQRYGAALMPSAVKFVEEFETGTSGKARL